MAFWDPVAYLVIKIWIKSKLPKIVLQQKNRVSENRKPKRPNCHEKLSPRRGLKFSPNN